MNIFILYMSKNKMKSDQFIIINEDKRKKEMMKYIKAHENEALNNYGYDKDKKNIKEKQKLAKYIHTHYDDMNMEERKEIFLKCLTEKKINKELLEFELRYYVEKHKPMSITEFTKKAKDILNRYQCKAGGFYIEDMDWEVHRSNSEQYDVKDYQVLFVNSIDKIDKNDNENLCYLKRLIKRLNSLSKEIEVEYDFFEPKKGGINWIEIWCSNKIMEENDSKIDL